MRVNESRKRSLLKAVSFRVIEIAASMAILYFWAGIALEVAFGLAVVIETICMLLHFGFERIWNKINYGRYIIKEDK